MAERRVELILRLPNLPRGARGCELEKGLATLARQLGGSLSRIERDHYESSDETKSYAVHVSRTAVVESGRKVGPRS